MYFRTLTFPHKTLGRYRALHLDRSGHLWVSKEGAVFVSHDHGDSFQRRASLRNPRSGRLTSLVQRVSRQEIVSLLSEREGSLVAVRRGVVFHCDQDSEELEPTLLGEGKTFKLCRTNDGLILCGEYFYNREKKPVAIYCSGDGGVKWEVLYRFMAGAVRHIHNMWFDPVRKGIFVLTGDMDHESKVLFTNDLFRTVDVVLEGSQSCRAMGILPAPGGYYLPTDTPHEQNYIQLLRSDGTLERRCPLPGSCLSASRVGSWSLFGTAVEPSRVNLDPSASLVGTRDGVAWNVLGRWRVNRIPGKTRIGAVLFQMGRVVLPYSESSQRYAFATTLGLQGVDGILHRWELL